VWEIVGGDGSLDLAAGDGFRVAGAGGLGGDRRAAFDLAGGWIGQLSGNGWQGSGYSFERLASAGHQDQLLGQVPLPATLALMLAGAAGGIAAQRRRAARSGGPTGA
jgi:hypothetical protein